MKKLFLLSLILLVTPFNSTAQEARKEIKDFLNTEIFLDNGFAGESITLIKEKKKYFVIRKIFGSGLSVVGTIKYSVNFDSDFQIDFSEIIESDESESKKQCPEKFRMSVLENEVCIYLNGLKLITEIKSLPNKTNEK